jgi:hypothetical protein
LAWLDDCAESVQQGGRGNSITGSTAQLGKPWPPPVPGFISTPLFALAISPWDLLARRLAMPPLAPAAIDWTWTIIASVVLSIVATVLLNFVLRKKK